MDVVVEPFHEDVKFGQSHTHGTLSKTTRLTWVEEMGARIFHIRVGRQVFGVDDGDVERVARFLERPDRVPPEPVVRAQLASVQRLFEGRQILRRYCKKLRAFRKLDRSLALGTWV